METETANLLTPPLDEVAKVLQDALSANFEQVEVKVVECPDLSHRPFRLASRGLGGTTRIADVGGPKYLAPAPQRERKYDLKTISHLMGIQNECCIFGAGAGPHHKVGCNCELMANAFISDKEGATTLSQVAKLDQDGGHQLQPLPNTEFAILGNFFACEGHPGPVLHVKAKKRTGENNFVSCMREGLAEKYGDKPVGIGGVFEITKGNVNIHIMPDFSKTPLNSSSEVDKWLRYFDFPAPMVFFSVFVSADPGLDLRVEHTHGHSVLDVATYKDHVGGHYHYDTTPEEVEYEGYFNLADVLYRIDRPK